MAFPRGHDRSGCRVADGLQRLVEVMDRLRSPGGCPWDAEQTHESLARHAIEETYELVEAIECGTRADLREELGDVLLQVVFHARVAQEHPTDAFDLDEVAGLVADKLVERHPHVFGDTTVSGVDEVHEHWERIKAESKARGSILDGIPTALPALARAQKVLSRVRRAGLDVRGPAGVGVGQALLDAVARAEAEGVDAEGELRAATRAIEDAIREAEA
jgi:XTP/dITP diphosphohydrolase